MLCGVPGTAFAAVLLNLILPGRNLKKQSLEDEAAQAAQSANKPAEDENYEENLVGVEVNVSGLEAPKPGEVVSPIDFEGAKHPENEKR